MRRSICLCEPTMAAAGAVSNWRFKYTTAALLPVGTKLLFDMLTPDHPLDWEHPQTSINAKKNVIWLELPNGKIGSPAVKGLNKETLSATYEFTLKEEVDAGETLVICMGSPSEDPSKYGNTAQKTLKRRRPFHFFIDPKGVGDYKEHEVFTLDIKGNVLDKLRVIAPSLVERNKPFNVIIRFEDIFGNLTGNAPEETLINFYFEKQRESLKRQFFVPETGYISFPNMSFSEEGVYRFELTNTLTNRKFISDPIRCVKHSPVTIYWGLVNGESEKVDPLTDIESTYSYFREDASYDFYAPAPLEDAESTTQEQWKKISNFTAEFNEENRFTTFLAFQYVGEPENEGARILVYAKDNKPMLRRSEMKSSSLEKIYQTQNPKELLSIPIFTMNKKCPFNFENYNPEFERVVEIYNAWGCSEMTKKEGNSRAIEGKGKDSIGESKEGAIVAALNKNCRFGFIAGGLVDRGIFKGLYKSEQTQYSPGLTAILADFEQTREGLWSALLARKTYATTGPKIVVDFTLAGASMGSELTTQEKPGLKVNRHIEGKIACRDKIDRVEIVRNGVVIETIKSSEDKESFTNQDETLTYTFLSNYHSLFFELDDTTPLAKTTLNIDSKEFVYYYLRIFQVDGHMAWSSPIWVDLVNGGVTEVSLEVAKPKKGKKSS